MVAYVDSCCSFFEFPMSGRLRFSDNLPAGTLEDAMSFTRIIGSSWMQRSALFMGISGPPLISDYTA